MSMQIKAAMGDPGLFGDIFGAVKGAVGGFIKGGPLGAVKGALGSFGGGPGPGSVNMRVDGARWSDRKQYWELPAGRKAAIQGPGPANPYQVSPMPSLRTGGPFILPPAPSFAAVPGPTTPSLQTRGQLPVPGSGVVVRGPFGIGGQVGTFGPQLPAGPMNGVMTSPPVFVGAPGQNGCARKTRRINPLNPKALSRAMRRITSFKKATSVADSIEIKKKCRRR